MCSSIAKKRTEGSVVAKKSNRKIYPYFVSLGSQYCGTVSPVCNIIYSIAIKVIYFIRKIRKIRNDNSPAWKCYLIMRF